MQKRVLITGSNGLVGSSRVSAFVGAGWSVDGVDNNFRAVLFGPRASTHWVREELILRYAEYTHHDVDIRDRGCVRELIRNCRPDAIIHAAAQPSHDKASSIPYDDFDINAVGTLNVLVAARDHCLEAPICYLSTNKVYGDLPNRVEYIEADTRFDFADGRPGFSEDTPVDQCLHSLFGASKLAADVLAQEFGRYFSMPVGIFRCGCITGPRHAAVELHGFLAYLVYAAVNNLPYCVKGFKGKQVRDQIHSDDLAELLLGFVMAPRCGEVYNVGGGRANSISILEALEDLDNRGCGVRWTYDAIPRIGDHRCYITDMSKAHEHFPTWKLRRSLPGILAELVQTLVERH